jgi:hypothetical protein
MLKATLSALAASLVVSGTLLAQTPPEQKGDAAKPTAAEEKKSAMSRHEHARDHKQGAPAGAVPAADKTKKKKPLHDHGKMHKQQ